MRVVEEGSSIIPDAVSGLSNQVSDTSQVGSRRYWVLIVLTMIYAFNASDRTLLSVVAEPIRAEFNLTDTQLGLLTGVVFSAFYSISGIPIAYVADKYNRVRLIALSCTIWTIFSGISGLAQSFTQLAVMRIGVAIGEAGGTPPSHSLISDYFPPRARGRAFGIFVLGGPFGIFLATALGGWLASVGGWRFALLVASAPGIILALLLLAVAREPNQADRSITDDKEQVSLLATMRLFVQSPILRNATLGATFSMFVSHGITAWLPAFLMRSKGMTMAEVASYYSAASGAGMMVGVILAGWIIDKVARRTHWVPLVPGIAFLVALPFFGAAVWTSSWAVSLVLLIIPTMALWTYFPAAIVVIHDNVPKNRKATSSALLLFCTSIIGYGGSGLYVGVISDIAKRYDPTHSLHIALTALLPIFALAFVFQFLASSAIQKQRVKSGAAPR